MILQSNDTEIKKLPSCDNCSVTMDTGRFLKIQDRETEEQLLLVVKKALLQQR